ncbi:MAG: hydrogenase maturation protease [Candidatus Zixiibacteriota bacterium]|nr:MAG: hydrogenase maturation protease [candidate division Zixibacteria bacterium]
MMNVVRKCCLIIGIGNEFRSDDGAGLYVARQLLKLKLPDVVVKEGSGEGTYLLHCWQGYERVIVVDAAKSSSAPGLIHRIDTARDELPTGWSRHSSHTLGLPEAIRLAETQGSGPKSLIVYGIEGGNFQHGVTLSPEVKAAAHRLVELIVEELQSLRDAMAKMPPD